MGINVASLEKNYLVVLPQMKKLKLEHLLESLGQANLSMVKDLYTNLNYQKDEAWV